MKSNKITWKRIPRMKVHIVLNRGVAVRVIQNWDNIKHKVPKAKTISLKKLMKLIERQLKQQTEIMT